MWERTELVIDKESNVCYNAFRYKYIIVALILKSVFLCLQYASRKFSIATVSCWHLLILLLIVQRTMNLLLKRKATAIQGGSVSFQNQNLLFSLNLVASYQSNLNSHFKSSSLHLLSLSGMLMV